MLKPIALFALVACLGGCAVAPGYGYADPYGYPDPYETGYAAPYYYGYPSVYGGGIYVGGGWGGGHYFNHGGYWHGWGHGYGGGHHGGGGGGQWQGGGTAGEEPVDEAVHGPDLGRRILGRKDAPLHRGELGMFREKPLDLGEIVRRDDEVIVKTYDYVAFGMADGHVLDSAFAGTRVVQMLQWRRRRGEY